MTVSLFRQTTNTKSFMAYQIATIQITLTCLQGQSPTELLVVSCHIFTFFGVFLFFSLSEVCTFNV